MAEADPQLDIDNALPIEEEHVEAPPPRTVEDFARERGWRPKEEYAGNADEWRDAESFVAWGLDRSRDMARDLKTMRGDVDRIVRTTADITAQSIERARAEERAKWEGQHARAVEEGDGAAARTAMDKIVELSVPTAPANTDPRQDPLVQSFVAENAWFNTDHRAQGLAVTTADIAAKAGQPVSEQLRLAKEAVLKAYPEHAPPAAKAPPGVAAPVSRANPTAGRKKGFSDLPANAQAVARQLIAKGYTTAEGYAANYFSSNGG